MLAAAFDRLGIETGVDVAGAARRRRGRRAPLHAAAAARWTATRSRRATPGVYSSFLLHAERAGRALRRPGARDPAAAVGELGYVGGQEDMIIDIALELAREREQGR